MDFIIIHGSPGNGKTTVASLLHEKLQSPWFEFGWIPEFTKLNPHTMISQEDEDNMSFENLMLVSKNYSKHGFKNIILSDFNDVRLLDIPKVFRSYEYIIFTLFSESDETLKNRILTRENGNTYRNWRESIKINSLIKNRRLLPNEYRIRSDTVTPKEIIGCILDALQKHSANNEYVRKEYSSDEYFTYVKGYSSE